MDVIGTSAALPTPRTPDADESAGYTKNLCNSLIRHMRDWVGGMETACEAGDFQRLLALSAALGESNAYLAGVVDKVVRC